MTILDLRYNLKCILREKGLSQVDLAEKLGMSPTNLNTRLARGKRCQIDLLDNISQILNVSIDELMEGKSSTEAGRYSQTTAMEEIMYREKYEAAQQEIILLLKENAALKSELSNQEPEKKSRVSRKLGS